MTNSLVCDGCGRAASPEHLAARIGRLEWATRFRPIHIQVLFVAEAPGASPEADYQPLFEALHIPAPEGAVEEDGFAARLTEFQRRGFCLAYLVECSADGTEGARAGSQALCERFGPTLVRRIQFSYRPKQIVLLSATLVPLLPFLLKAGLGEQLILIEGRPVELPQPGAPKTGKGGGFWERLRA